MLLVDDDPDIVQTFRKSLEYNGFIVDVYTSPTMAISEFKTNTYDFVLVDISMPDMDGFEFYDKAKEIDSNIKVCFMTAYDVNYQSLQSIFEEPDIEGAYFKKPFEIKDLVKYLKKELENSG